MQKLAALAVAAACSCLMFGQEPAPVRPRAGKVQIFKEADLKTRNERLRLDRAARHAA